MFIFFILKLMNICPAWVVLWNVWRIKGNRITYIGILMLVIAEILPDPRHRYLPEPICIIAFFIKFFLQVINALIETEFPVSIQKFYSVRFFPVMYEGSHAGGSRYIVGTVWHGILMQHVKIFIMLRYDHVISSQYVYCFAFVVLSLYFFIIKKYINNIRQNMHKMLYLLHNNQLFFNNIL